MEETKHCPYCAEKVLIQAKKCRYCHEWLPSPIKINSKNLHRSSNSKIRKETSNADEIHIEVDEELLLRDSYFFYQDKKYSYEGISQIALKIKEESIFFIMDCSELELFIAHKDLERLIIIRNLGIPFANKKGKIIKQAFTYLNNYLSPIFFDCFLAELENHGKVRIFEDTWLDCNANLIQGSQIVNLLVSREMGEYHKKTISVESDQFFEGTGPYFWSFSEKKGWWRDSISPNMIINFTAKKMIFEYIENQARQRKIL